MKRFITLFSILIFSFNAKGQVLISLVFGDKLNSGKIEFGLDGGANFSTLDGISGASSNTGFHLGFYFDIKTKSDWMVHTGVIVKSPLGASGLAPYVLNNPTLDTAFTGGEVTRNLQYFNVPLMLKHSVYKYLYAEGGIQLGLLFKASDEFSQNVKDPQDLTYRLSILDQCNRIDAGVAAGIGYRLMGGNGMNLGVRYYYGLVSVFKDGPASYNRSLYLAVGIPIGAGKAKAQRGEQPN